MTRDDALERLRAVLADLRARHRVRALSVFGSTARGEARPDSDVDVLVDFEGAADFDGFMELKFALEKVLGVRVDLVTRGALRPLLAERISREALRVA